MKFMKRTDLDGAGNPHPTSVLPSCLWDPASDSPLFAFTRRPDGCLELETDDPQLIDLLTSAGYGREEK
jgi:hypothetical protein